MRADQAKKLDLPTVMQRLGFVPVQVKQNGGQLWYRSPFREEADASFQVSRGKSIPWVWNDHGDHASGTVIDFVMRYKGCDIKGALAFLDQLMGTPTLFQPPGGPGSHSQGPIHISAPHDQAKAETYASELKLLSTGKLRHPAIYSYLEKKRGISRTIAEKYLKQVQYIHEPSGRTFFAMGMKNQADGYEIRIASDDHSFTKSCLGSKDITVIPGSSGEKAHVNVIEGMLDALSLMQYYRTGQLKYDTIILNTASFLDRAVDYIQKQGYESVNAFLDNDRAGAAFIKELQEKIGPEKVIPQNRLYEGYKDLNEMLVATRQTQVKHSR